ncbi:MAG: DNA polymerase I [Candidatus Magasanikbacteria bacterium]|nr:DNA polymerase I [Candidatus Magasanikbacteria bacterium]
MKRLIIIDGNAIIHRAYHALPPMITKKGVLVNAVYGFTSMLLKVWRDLKPEYIAVTFDMAGPTFRHEKYDKYKATRVKADQELYDQIPMVHDLVSAFNIPIFEKQGYEADDVIGTVVKKTKNNTDLEIVVVTGDKDTLQLIDKNVKVFTLRKGMSDTVTYDAAAVKETFGFNPEQMIDYKALRGDASDNIPGVPGVGEKTAVELLQKFGSVKEIYKTVNSKKKRESSSIKPGVLEKLISGEESANMSYELATIDQNVPGVDFILEDCRAKDFDREKVVKLFQEMEFVSLLKRLPGSPVVELVKKEKTKRGAIKKIIFEEINDRKSFEKVGDKLRKMGVFSCRALTSGDDIFSAKFYGFALVIGEYGYFISEEAAEMMKDIFSDESLTLIAHDIKKLAKILLNKKWLLRNEIFDLMLASYLLSPGSRAHDPISIVLKYLGKELSGGGSQNSLFGPDARVAIGELHMLTLAKDNLQRDLESANNLDLLTKIEIPVALILAQMEINGIAVDLAELDRLSKHIAGEIQRETKAIYEMAGSEFNIGSPVQLREVLFEKMDIPALGIKKGKTGLSTAAAELEKMRGLHPIIDKIEHWRELTKLQNTYVDVLPLLVNPKTGRVHTTYNQAVTATGRLSSSDPNLQNIPIRSELGAEIRKTFIAEKGNILISADYSQIELRIVASLAEDKKMIEIFQRGEDIHRATAAAINGVPLDKVTKEMRRAAKEVNFGVLYGMGSYGLSWRADLTQADAKRFIDKYFSEFSGVKKYLEDTIAFAKKEGYSETLFGRRRYIPELNASNFQLRAAAERMAINHPVQGTAADLMKMAMIEIEKKLNKYSSDEVKLLLQVHDELVFEVKEGLAGEVSKIVKDAMETVVHLRVAVIVEVHTAKNWGEIK